MKRFRIFINSSLVYFIMIKYFVPGNLRFTNTRLICNGRIA